MESVRNKNRVKGTWNAVLLGVLLLMPTMILADETKETNSQAPSGSSPDSTTLANSTAVEAVSAKDLTQMSLESLAGLNVLVVSASKKTESLRDATSAIYVITQEDIQRSGAQYLPDLLAMVPGVQVARQNANQWAISARGFNGQYNNKMLVLVDGRSVYDPVQGGVAWNEQDIPLEEIERIEVIRGPGGTLWGSNAVNGIVNIITKDSKQTQGLYLSGTGGTNLYPSGVSGTSALNGTGFLRYGGKLSDDLYYRIYGQVINQNPDANVGQDPYDPALGSAWNDEWHDYRAGFRSDWHAERDQITLEAEAQKGYFNYANLSNPGESINYFNPNNPNDYFPNFGTDNDLNTEINQNAHLLGRWTRNFVDGSQVQVLGYYDYNNTTTVNDARIQNVGQADLEFQHRFHLGGVNEITWGGSYRNISDQFYNPTNEQYLPANQNLNIYAGYLQDKLTLEEGRLYLTGGVKLENNPYTGNEWQPSGRLLYTPDNTNSLWAAVSRAVRIPTQFGETATTYMGGLPAGAMGPGSPAVYAGVIPNTSVVSETLISYEVGYRTNPTVETSLDVATFYNHYENLLSFQDINGGPYPTPNGGIMDPASGLPVYQLQNTGMGDIYGIEVGGQWKPCPSLRVNVSYTYQSYDTDLMNSTDIELGAPPPHNLANARIYFDPLPGWELNTSFYFTDATYMYDIAQDDTTITPSYVQWNLGASFKPAHGVRISIWGLDLQGAHTETLQSAYVFPAEVVPSVRGEVSVQF